ncbi:BREX-6 system phosphatase PglZ [Enhygromyxa salina]|uniref:PglZ domain protein n=1 Tax=Enhygromyxa salina TaxID=215803 RepID=A0A2S9YJ49_9BACT|nr:BREX-6 system phosphatase PglZ [Enhygromyxa salina]PRQ05137.1 PglZ domain protein [Enhygromyxa salina]
MIDLTHKPVSAKFCEVLEADIGSRQLVVLLDVRRHYTELVDALREAGGWVAPVLAHRGSYLELMVELEHHAGSIDPSPVLVHLPGDIEVTKTPMLEIAKAGKMLRKALDTLVREAAIGKVTPDQVEAFLAEQGDDLSLANADAWMAAKVSAASGELTGTLQAMSLTGLATALLDPSSPLVKSLASPAELGPIWHHLASHLGLPDDWAYPVPRERVSTVQAGDVMASWVLCVEYVHDLRREVRAPVLRGIRGSLPARLRDACFPVARWLRKTAPSTYDSLARDVEAWLPEELAAGRPGELGRIDTFRFEEQQLCLGALDALDNSDWDNAAEWARERLEGESFWVRRELGRDSAWILIAAVAALGQAVVGSKLEFRSANSLEEATLSYVERGAQVDRRHRELAQQATALLFSKLPYADRLRLAIEHVRKIYVAWQDARAREWSALCEREGALPGPALQQRQLFDEVVRPLVGTGKTALFLVDALRFEMATELVELIDAGARLRPRLAELPTVTEICMNALAPIAQAGKLRPLMASNKGKPARRFAGLSTATFQYKTPDDRKKAMASGAGGTTCPSHSIDDWLRKSVSEVRQSVGQAKLALVLSTRIDVAGGKGDGPSVFAGELLRIRAAWQLLREAGVTNFVITADHGFLLREKGDATLAHGQGHDALARYALYDVPISNTEQYSVALRSLAYENVEGYLLLPRGCAVYEIAGDSSFVHGGNSPQERVIPVLTLEHKQPAGGSDRRYQLELCGSGSIDGMHFVDAQLLRVEGNMGLEFVEPPSVDFDVRVVGDERTRAFTNQAGLDAQMRGGVVHARVGRRFRVLFRLTGPRGARVEVELFHPSGTQAIVPALIDRRFDVTEAKQAAEDAAAPAVAPAAEQPSAAPVEREWLDSIGELKVRRVFAHIEQFGAINEQEATTMLGSPRAFRRFAANFEELAKIAPFTMTIEIVGATKRYVKRSQK